MEDPSPHTPFQDELSSRSAAALGELQARARTIITARNEQVSRLSEITERLDSLAALLSERQDADAASFDQLNTRQAEVEALRAELEQAQAVWREEHDAQQATLNTLGQQIEEREARLAAQDEELRGRESELSQREQALARRGEELAERERSLETIRSQQENDHQAFSQREAVWIEEKSKLEAERSHLLQQLDRLTAQHQSSQEDSSKRLAEVEQKLRDRQTGWEQQQAELEAARAAAERNQAQLAAELASTQEKLKAADGLAAAASERDELNQKFELALADVQRFRARVAELEQELARRPEVGAADSAELVHLRAEREALAAKVEELERTATAEVDADTAQQIADQQRRFELAVEDVRELKKKNAELESQLAAVRQLPVGAADSGGMDWESQKRRLLASLEGEGDDVEPQRSEERTTIQNTIEITDVIVAEKDQEINVLRAQLAVAGSSPAAEDEGREAVEKLLDADEVIVQHRQRAAELEKQLEDQLRAAELELSVARAKVAREKAEIEEWRAELETFRKSREAGEPPPTGKSPRRRWLSKLGLNSDESG